ncbi:MAG: leucine-rich repeat protein [Salinivirgaceae bacterium]|nr:leucine-rich repeat protein [Salinivirgaceae bacterium]
MKRLLAFVFATMLAGQVWAYNFQSGDLYYSITSDSTVAVACQTEWDNRHNNYLGLTTITIPEFVTYDGGLYAVTSIGGWAFQYCSSLTSVTIPESVISIGLYAFDGCIGLKNITIPDGVTAIGNSAFYNVGNIIYTGNAEGSPWGALAVNGIIDGDFVYSDAEKKKIALYIGDSTNVTIPAGVTQIGARAFYNCKLTTVIIPDSVTSIGSAAFYGCPLTFVTIPISVNTIGRNAFNSNATFYCEANIRPSNWVYSYDSWNSDRGNVIWGSFVDNDILYQRNSIYDSNTGNYDYSDSLVSLIKYLGDSSSVEIPAKVNRLGSEYKVTSIENLAFSGCSNLTSVIIACDLNFTNAGLYFTHDSIRYQVLTKNTVSVIANGYSGKVIIPDTITAGNTFAVTNISNDAFAYRVNLTSITIGDSVKSIGSGAFRNCKGLKSISIPKSVTNIGSYAFLGCDSLQKAEFASIGSLCGIDFYDSQSNPLFYAKRLYVSGEEVTDVVIPDSVESIGQYAFYNCDNLTSVSIPYSVTSIGQYVFNQCYGLTSVSIPNSVTAIGYGAFKDCINLTIYCQAKIKHSGWDEKWNISKCPVSWGATLNTVTVKSENNTGGKVSGSGVYINNLTVTITATPAAGYHFVSWSDGNTDNPRIINANGDLDLSAVFDDTYRIMAAAQNGTIAYDTVYHEGDTATITATPSIGYHFVGWSDGSTDNPRVMVVAKDSAINALFELNTYSITATAENGTVSGTATYNYGTVATLTATPNQGYHFVKWDDGNTDNPRKITVCEELTLSAVFEADENQGGNNEGGSENQGGNENNTATAVTESTANAVNIYAHVNTIVIENATDEIRVYNAMGALVCRDAINRVRTEIPINGTGVYIVKTGDVVKRVVVN